MSKRGKMSNKIESKIKRETELKLTLHISTVPQK